MKCLADESEAAALSRQEDAHLHVSKQGFPDLLVDTDVVPGLCLPYSLLKDDHLSWLHSM